MTKFLTTKTDILVPWEQTNGYTKEGRYTQCLNFLMGVKSVTSKDLYSTILIILGREVEK
jgi:hypothetical protein